MNPDDWTPPSLRVEPVNATDEETARTLAKRLAASAQLLIDSPYTQADVPVAPLAGTGGRFGRQRGSRTKGGAVPVPWRLLVDGERRIVVRPDGARTAPDFTDAGTRRRTATLGPAGEPLLRALGVASLTRKLGRSLTVIDTTAGFGADSWLAASVGCSVRMLERSLLMAELLQQALVMARALPATADTAARIMLCQTDAADWLLQAANPAADVIYLDPMFPVRGKSARVGKDMQFLHELLPDTRSAGETGAAERLLLHAAIDRAGFRVVVKRPRGAPRLDDSVTGTDVRWPGQVTTIESPGLRYDVYQLHRSDHLIN